MKKYTFLIFYREYDQFLTHLRELGVVHITTKSVALSENVALQETIAYSEKLQSVLGAISTLATPSGLVEKGDKDAKELLTEWDTLVKRKNDLEQQIQVAQKEVERVRVWGNFSTEKLQSLASEGYVFHFFACPKDKFSPDMGVQVAEEGSAVYFVAIEGVHAVSDIQAMDGCTEQIVEKSFAFYQQDVQALLSQKVQLEQEICTWATANISTLKNELVAAKQSIDWQSVEISTMPLAEGTIQYVEGFCPQNNSAALDALLEREKIYYQCEIPTPDDATPIELRNNFFSRLFEPITRLYSLPNYAELDPTPFFAPFFMLFFGLCLGDGGYGLVVFLAGLLVVLKKPKLKEWGWLGIFMGLMTMVVGVLTGVFFGINLEEVAFLAPVRQYFITESNAAVEIAGSKYHPLMVFSIVIGVFQILFAMGFKVVKIALKNGFKYALYDLAWLILLVAGIVWLIISPEGTLTYVFYAIFGLCALFILFYKDPDKKILLANVGSGLWGTYNMISGLLGDVLSYIRLFALGLAGGILGSVFNQLALQVGDGMPSWIGWLPTLFILLFGHGLNFALCLISSVVHPLRLTFVEFYKNADFEGGGMEYKPFKKYNK